MARAPAHVEEGPPIQILLAEDDQAFREMLTDALESGGFLPIPVASAEEALRAASSRPIDLLLADVMMPGMSGAELAQRLRLDRQALPVLFMSGCSEPVLRGRIALPDDALLLHKPFAMKELAQKIREALAGRKSSDGDG